MTSAEAWESNNEHPRDLWEMLDSSISERPRLRKWLLAMSAFAQRATVETRLPLDSRTFDVLDARIDATIGADDFNEFRDRFVPAYWNHVNPDREINASNAVAAAFGAVGATTVATTAPDPNRMAEALYWQPAEDAFADPAAESVNQATIFKDIFGNPFRPVAFDPRWRTEHTVGIAAKMYEDRDFAAMPILADALEEAGCDGEAILSHCRESGVHVRGCWVVDLVRGTS